MRRSPPGSPGLTRSPSLSVWPVAIALSLRNKLAIPLYVVSLAAVVIQMGYISFAMNSVEIRGAVSLIFPTVIIVLGALQLLGGYAREEKRLDGLDKPGDVVRTFPARMKKAWSEARTPKYCWRNILPKLDTHTH